MKIYDEYTVSKNQFFICPVCKTLDLEILAVLMLRNKPP